MVLLVAPEVTAILKFIITNLTQSPKGKSPLSVSFHRPVVHSPLILELLFHIRQTPASRRQSSRRGQDRSLGRKISLTGC